MITISPIVPAIIPTSLNYLYQSIKLISGLPEIHIDVVDGIFVPFRSWPYNTKEVPWVAKKALDVFSLEVDLMVSDPLLAAQNWIEAGADQLVFHVETISPNAFKEFTNNTNITIGISANNDTDINILYEYLPSADYVQVMGISKIGTQGQPFDSRALDRIKLIRQDFPKLSISIDGSVNKKTLPMIIDLRPDRIIIGSAIMKHANPILAYRELTTSIS